MIDTTTSSINYNNKNRIMKIERNIDYDENTLVDVVFTKELLDYVKRIGLIEGVDYFIY